MKTTTVTTASRDEHLSKGCIVMHADTSQGFEDPYSFSKSCEPSYFRLQSFDQPASLQWDAQLPDIPDGLIKQYLECLDKSDDPADTYPNVFGHVLEPIDAQEPASSSSAAIPFEEVDERSSEAGLLSDIWSLDVLPDEGPKASLLKSWDRFYNRPSAASRPPLYLSEAGNEGYDAALAHQSKHEDAYPSGRLAPTDVFLLCLFLAGLGRNSILFRYDETSGAFVKKADDARISGISLLTTTAVVDEVLDCGAAMRKARSYVQSTTANDSLPNPVLGLASAISVLLDGLESGLCHTFMQRPSLLRLHMLFQRTACLLQSAASIADSCRMCQTDGEAVSTIFRTCADWTSRNSWLSPVLNEVMRLVADPWLSLIETWIGLRPDPYSLLETSRGGKGFVKATWVEHQVAHGDRHGSVEYEYHAEAMPEFLPKEYAEQIFECGRNLRILKSYHPLHPLVVASKPVSQANPRLHLAVDWEDIGRMQGTAAEYEEALRSAILLYYRGMILQEPESEKEADNDAPHKSSQLITAEDTFELIDLEEKHGADAILPTHDEILSSKLYSLLSQSGCFDIDTVPVEAHAFGPPLTSSVLYCLSPIISAQARLVNFSCLQMIFQGHNLREHLNLQWRFQLMGDGVFSSRLSLLLFDPDMHSGERKRGVATAGVSTGLRLGHRDTWPPATSELRLVLLGLLSDCYHGKTKYTSLPNALQGDGEQLPGGLSFSIRQLDSDELRAFRNPDSLEALDFLRLHYSPPAVLDTVITPESLEKYDMIFKHLLRLTRLSAVACTLARQSSSRHAYFNGGATRLHLFRMEAMHFVQSLADYIFQVGIGQTWRRFGQTLKRIEKGIEKGDIDQTIAHARSVESLRRFHEETLDKILFAMLLKKEHREARRLLDEILSIILLFAPVSDTIANARDDDDLDYHALFKRVSQLHTEFQRQARQFVQSLEGSEDVKVARSKKRQTDLAAWSDNQRAGDYIGTVFDHLLLRLNFKAYY